MKIFKRLLLIFLIAGIVGAAGFVYWCLDAYRPQAAALDALRSDGEVEVAERDGVITFTPAGQKPDTGFVFVPGARVDYRAYAPALRRIAARGFFVAIVDVRLNMALFEPAAPERVISKHTDIVNWTVGGHSLGGVGAAGFAANNPARVRGVVFWASYPIDESLKNTDLKVLSVYGTRDMGGLEPFDRSRNLLPAAARFVAIDGGNHANFGSYGPQSGDLEATIPAEAQWTRAADETIGFLEEIR